MLRERKDYVLYWNEQSYLSHVQIFYVSPQTLSTVTSSPRWGSSTISSPSTGMCSGREAAKLLDLTKPKWTVHRDHILISIILLLYLKKKLFYVWNWAYTYIYSVWKIFSNHILLTYLYNMNIIFYDEYGNGHMEIMHNTVIL